MGSSHVVFLYIFFYGDVTQKRHWQKNLPVGFNGLNSFCHLQGVLPTTVRAIPGEYYCACTVNPS